MLNILSLLLAMIVGADSSEKAAPPLCLDPASCHPYFLATSEAFERGSAPEVRSFIASGSCRHYSSMYSPDVDQFAYVVIDSVNDKFHLGGDFAFFFSENPYSSLSVSEGRERDGGFESPRREVEIQNGYLFADMNKEDPTNPWRQWIRKDTLGNFVVLAQLGRGQLAYCNLTEHK